MRIRLAENFRALFYAPFYAAHALGLFQREGVEVELRPSSGPGDAVPALLAGDIDITWGGPMRVMKAHDADPHSPLVAFCEVVARDPFYLVGKPRPQFQLGDLRELRLATVSEVPTPWMCLQHDLRERGVDPNGITRVTGRSMADNLAALCAGEIDVVQLFEPFVSVALREGAREILYTASARGPTVYTTFIATRETVSRCSLAFAGMARAMRQVHDWLAEHGAVALAETTARFFPDVERDLLVSSFRRYQAAELWGTGGEVSRQGFARLAESLLSGGFISRRQEYENCVVKL